MIKFNDHICPKCGHELLYFDKVKRIVRTKNRKTSWVKLRRYKCPYCGSVHRELTEDILPFKQYEAEIIFGILEGIINYYTPGFEDYPCEMTVARWKTQYLHSLL